MNAAVNVFHGRVAAAKPIITNIKERLSFSPSITQNGNLGCLEVSPLKPRVMRIGGKISQPGSLAADEAVANISPRDFVGRL